jgi:hypothetical protein
MDACSRRFRPSRGSAVALARDCATRHRTRIHSCNRNEHGHEARGGPAAQSPAPQLITFDEYRDFRMQNIGQRQVRLAEQLAAPNLSAAEKAGLEQRKAYYDRLAAMPAGERDAIFRVRFDQIDTNHDGTIDVQERAAWREKQREHYRQAAADRTQSPIAQH